MSEIVIRLLFSIAGLVIGFVGGQATAWRRYSQMVLPAQRAEATSSNRIIGTLVVMVTFVMMAQGVWMQNQQSRCNDEFRKVISERADVNRDQTQAAADLQRRLSNLGTSEQDEQLRREARTQYLDKLELLDEQKQRNPYPNPTCP